MASTTELIATTLHAEVSKILPINGVSVISETDRSTWNINYKVQPTASQKKDIDYIIANIQVISSEQDAINRYNRADLFNRDYKTIKKFEETLLTMRDSRKVAGKYIKPNITPASGLEERCLADDEYMAILEIKKAEREAVKDNSITLGVLPSKV